jgi:hypothetical protein
MKYYHRDGWKIPDMMKYRKSLFNVGVTFFKIIRGGAEES